MVTRYFQKEKKKRYNNYCKPRKLTKKHTNTLSMENSRTMVDVNKQQLERLCNLNSSNKPQRILIYY